MSSSTSLSSSSLPAPGGANGGPVVATNNIINQRADASRSLYQICVNLRQRLALVPNFQHHLNDADSEEPAEESDPVTSLWRCLRKGTPLLTIYNTLQPPEPLQIDETVFSEAKRPKRAAFMFVQACLKDIKLPPAECFVINDLLGDDTTGFVKVTQVINIVLDVAEQRGLLQASDTSSLEQTATAGGQLSYRDHVVREIVDTERKYVQDLENLHELKKVIEEKGVVPGDVVHDIFLNINAILDFQRRFLIKVETTNSQPQERQEWGNLFVNFEEYFSIYQPFIANQRRAAAVAMREFDKIAMANHPVCVDFNTLDGFLLKPMQRLVKYPLLLKDLRDKTNADEATREELSAGMDAANRVLHLANAAVDREMRAEALQDLCSRVDDWKNHQVDQFGDLLLNGVFTVVTGKSDIEKEYAIYLFERILLCCKEINPNKATKDKLMGAQKDKSSKKDKDKKDKLKNGKLQLKGRIFMTNVTEVVSLAKPGSYTVQIWWKGDPGVENFVIRFKNEEAMKKWSMGVDGQRKKYTDQTSQPNSAAEGPAVDFPWMRDQASNLSNPYAQQDDDDDEDDYPIQTPSSSYGMQQQGAYMPRNGSTVSLRSRSTTGESTQSLASVVRAPPPRFPNVFQNPPLSVQTQMPTSMPSPGTRGGDSYFSPVAESPASSRTSGGPSMYPFPRQATPQGPWEDSNRYTAPAMARQPSRDSSTTPTGYGQRSAQRPSLPPMASNGQTTQRSRSYSTPDINGPNGGSRRMPNGSVPAVPGIPAHLHPAYDAGIPRSQNNSPSNGYPTAALPIRANTQSPGVQRERLLQQPPFPTAPINGVRGTPVSMSIPLSPPLPSAVPGNGDLALPTQLKVKVNCNGNYVTLVVALNITYQSLVDRIDAKVGRFSNSAIARGTMRLRYRDEDGDFVTIESDDDIQIAFQEWREAQKDHYHTGQLGEIELFCLSVDP